ncbi:MAG: hypothetical protein NC340_08130 [Ruminococcus flavefaciens]|nr:hypothetical protein [Ruminococcus flavefaciens]MCM1229664.1 hypothetical protein [Ruminococcus flavefaciens]
MNHKLKNLLKNTYGAEPERKYSFIQQLQSNPVWQNLHPVGTIFTVSPAVKLVFATLAVITVGTGAVAYHFRDNNNPPDIPPVVPPIITTISETTATSAVTSYTAENTTHHAVSSVVSADTAIKSTSQTSSLSTTGTSTSASTRNSIVSSKATSSTAIQTTAHITESETTSATTSVYYTHLFRHDYTIDDIETDDIVNSELLYGYPDYNFCKDLLRAEAGNPRNFDELTDGMTTADFTEAMFELLTAFGTNTIVEGETTGIKYIAYEGKPWTICEITVSKAYSSSNLKNLISKGDKIKIAMPGGYMPVSEYLALNPGDTAMFEGWTAEQIDSTVIYEDGSNQNPPEIGDKYLYYLSESDIDIPVENLYTRVLMSDITQFTAVENGFISCNSHFQDYVLEQGELELLKQRFVYYDEPDGDRRIAFLDNSFLMFGEFYCYSVDSDGKMNFLGCFDTDDGFFPFRDEDYSIETDGQGRKVMKAEHYNIVWTDTGVTLKYHFDSLFDTEDEFTVAELEIH